MLERCKEEVYTEADNAKFYIADSRAVGVWSSDNIAVDGADPSKARFCCVSSNQQQDALPLQHSSCQQENALPLQQSSSQHVGTPGFQSPEQLKSESVGMPSDVYVFGGVFAVLFEEQPLWAGLNPYQIMYRVTMAKETPPYEAHHTH